MLNTRGASCGLFLYYGRMISREEVEGLARLARLALQPEEVASLQQDMESILGYVGQLSNVTPLAVDEAAPVVHNVMRADEPHAVPEHEGSHERILAAFPEREGDYLSVRTIIQKDA